MRVPCRDAAELPLVARLINDDDFIVRPDMRHERFKTAIQIVIAFEVDDENCY